jgi:chaperonin GroES
VQQRQASVKVQIRPTSDRLIVLPLQDAERMSKGGIVLPGMCQEEWLQAEVLAIGPGIRLENGAYARTEVRIGDVVWYRKNAGLKFQCGEHDCVIIHERDVMAVVIESREVV